MNNLVDHPAGTWPQGVLCVRLGPGANCSSIGSAINLLFASGVMGGVAAVIAAALARAEREQEQEHDAERGSEREAEDG